MTWSQEPASGGAPEALVWGGGAGHSELGRPWDRRPRDTGQSSTDGPSNRHRQPSASVPGARVASRVYANDQQPELEETQTRERAMCPAGHWQLKVPGSEGTGTRRAH